MDELNARIAFPLDMGDWVEPATLCLWVEEEVKKLNGAAPAVDVRKKMLAVLSFAYARGVFDSEEILDLCRSDALYRSLCEGVDFSWDDLQSVRHKDRGLLVTLTVRLLTRAVVEKFSVAAASLDPAVKRRLHESAVDRLDNARNMDRGEEE
ncbi:MAG TPA: hypothetical protein VJA21_02250 [Verrucomicrobiae bacterium]